MPQYPQTYPTTASAIGVPVSTSPVTQEISATEQRLADLHATIDVLEKVIGIALRPSEPTPQPGQPAGPPVGMADLTLRQRGVFNGVDLAVYRLTQLAARVEL